MAELGEVGVVSVVENDEQDSRSPRGMRATGIKLSQTKGQCHVMRGKVRSSSRTTSTLARLAPTSLPQLHLCFRPLPQLDVLHVAHSHDNSNT